MAPHCIRILWFVFDVWLLIAAGGIGLVLLLDVGCEQAADFILNSLHQVRHMLFVFILLTYCTCQARAPLAWAGGPAGWPSWRALRLGRRHGGQGRGFNCSPQDYFQDPGQKNQTSSWDSVVRHKVLFQILGPKTRPTSPWFFVLFFPEVLVQILGQQKPHCTLGCNVGIT